MKINCWLLFGTMLSSSLLAQQVTNPPPAAPIETPAPAPMVTNVPDAAAVPPAAPVVTAAPAAETTNAPATKAKKKHQGRKKPRRAARKKPGAQLRTVPLVAGPATVEATHVNIRGQAKLKSEVVGHLEKGQQVTVLQEIVRNNSGPEEPSAWAKILLPPGSHVWVNTAFIDATNKTVLPRRLNLRGGPGENYSILGRLVRGDAVTDVSTKGNWTEIEAPTNAYAFVASEFLKQEAPGATTLASTEPAPAPAATTEPPATTNTVPQEPAIAAATEPPVTPAQPGPSPLTNSPAEIPAITNEPAATPTAAEEPPPKRIVEREGVVRGTFSIQAPTHFELYSTDTGKTLDYLYTSSPNLDLRRYKGLRIVVTGEEGLDERWGNTPVITIQKIQVLE